MKRSMLILLAAIAVLFLFAGCRRQKEPMPSLPTETEPAATTVPTVPSTAPTSPSIRETQETQSNSATIEDGNGPIASQYPTGERK